ncbi:hypothetical protein VTI28DRAFT_8906 [Corynascus sepedonium]
MEHSRSGLRNNFHPANAEYSLASHLDQSVGLARLHTYALSTKATQYNRFTTHCVAFFGPYELPHLFLAVLPYLPVCAADDWTSPLQTPGQGTNGI